MNVGKFLQLSLLILIAAGSQPAYSAWWQWSRTAASNGGVDPTINFQEGMSPSALNDSARALMARAAEFRDDTSGLLTTGGTSTAYTVATFQGLASVPNDGQLLSVTVNATNGANPTLTADGGTTYPIQSAAGVAVASGTLISGSPYSMRFSVANSAWMLKGFYASSTNIPIGALIDYTGAVAPNSNFILPAGQCISTATYATYWALIGSPASGGCPGGQFAVIDKRGRVSAGLDNLNGTAANRLTSAAAGCGTAITSVGAFCANGAETETITIAQMPVHYHTAGIYDPSHTHAYTGPASGAGTGTSPNYFNSSSAGYTTSASVTGVRINSSNGLDTTYSAGGGAAKPRVQHTIGVTVLLRVL